MNTFYHTVLDARWGTINSNECVIFHVPARARSLPCIPCQLQRLAPHCSALALSLASALARPALPARMHAAPQTICDIRTYVHTQSHRHIFTYTHIRSTRTRITTYIVPAVACSRTYGARIATTMCVPLTTTTSLLAPCSRTSCERTVLNSKSERLAICFTYNVLARFKCSINI